MFAARSMLIANTYQRQFVPSKCARVFLCVLSDSALVYTILLDFDGT